MPKPLLSADAIFDEALRIVAEEGAAGLTIRTLAARLRCSNKTLYQQVGTFEVLVRGVVARAFARLELAFSAGCPWEIATESWCTALRTALLDNPDLRSLMTVADRGVIVGYIDQLIAVLERDGFTHNQAVRAGGILAHVTLSMTLSDISAPGEWDDPQVFVTTVRWLVHGMALMRVEDALHHAHRPETVGSARQYPDQRNAS